MAMGKEVVGFPTLVRCYNLIWRLADWNDGVWFLRTCIREGVLPWEDKPLISTLLVCFMELLSGLFVMQELIPLNYIVHSHAYSDCKESSGSRCPALAQISSTGIIKSLQVEVIICKLK